MESKLYTITADHKKCSYQTEQWNNVLSNGRKVTYEITNYFYWGTFEIELTDKEKIWQAIPWRSRRKRRTPGRTTIRSRKGRRK